MTIPENSYVGSGGQKISIASLFSITVGANDPTYLVLTGLDRNEYTAGASDATGTLNGNGISDTFNNIGGDGRGIDVIFTYQASSGRYYSRTYGYFDQMTYTASPSNGDVTNLSLYMTNSLSLANADGDNAYAMAQLDAGGYRGSATVVTQASFTGSPPPQATPNSVCASAETFVGKAWNMNGCWVLASTIAVEAGASLPVDSAMIGIAGQANGEWIVAFDGSKQSGNWKSLVKAGEIIVIGSAGSGHITTCVSGSGSSAMLIDNVTYVNAGGAIVNSAGDGSSNDVTISAAHSATQEWVGVASTDVKIYELDAPVVSTLTATDTMTINAKQVLTQWFSAVDPAGKTLTEYQVYDTNGANSFSVNGATVSSHSAGSALTLSSLSSISLLTGQITGIDTVEVRAFNGAYWGDWNALTVSIDNAATAPNVENQTAAQNWTQGEHVSFVLPANTFIDPGRESLTLSATQSNGQPLPSWLSFTPATGTFSGIVPSGTSSFSIKLTATDTSKLSVSETFAVTIPSGGAAPAGTLQLSTQTATQIWTDGQKVSLTLPADTFANPQHSHMSYVAYEIGGTPITSWLTFNASTETFSGQVPGTATGATFLEVVATNSSGASATDIFAVAFGQFGSTTASLVGVTSQPAHGLALLHG